MNRSDFYFLLGLCFYVLPAFAVIFKQENVWAVNPGDQSIDLPLKAVALFTDRYLPAFYIGAVPAIFFLFLSFNSSTIKPLQKTILSSGTALAVFFVVPSLTWPIGNLYYETLDFYMGQLSLVLMFFVLFLFMLWRKT